MSISNHPDNPNVQVYVQRPEDGRFAKTRTEWVNKRSEAKCFETTVEALAFSIAARLGRVRLVVLEDDQAERVLHPFGERTRTILNVKETNHNAHRRHNVG